MDAISLAVAGLSLIATVVGVYVAWQQWRESKGKQDRHVEQPVPSSGLVSTAPSEHPTVSLFTLLPPVGRLFGLDDLVTELLEGLSTHQFNALVIEGIGGIGKTSLAVALSQRLGDVLWISCSAHNVTYESFVVSLVNVAQARGLSVDTRVFFSPGQTESVKTRELVKMMAVGQYKIAFDDYHLVRDDALEALLKTIINQCPQTILIFTTRVHLDFLEDPNLRLLPKNVSLKGLPPNVAVEYLRDLASVYPELQSADTDTLREVWQLAGTGHPIALKIFAMLTRHRSVSDLLADESGEYRERLDRWTGNLLESLSSDEISALGVLSTFRGSTPETAALTLLPEKRSRETISALLDRYLLERDAGRRLYLHPLIRDHICRVMSPEQIRQNHHLAGSFLEVDTVTNSEELKNSVEAYYHYRQAGEGRSCVRVVRMMKNALFDAGQYNQLSEIVAEIEPYVYEVMAEEAIRRKPVLFLGGGEVAHFMAQGLDPAAHYGIVMDRHLSVAARDADFQILLGGQGFRDTDRMVAILKSMSGAFHATPRASLPVVVMDYYGFDAEQVLNVSEDLGYQPFPSKKAALVASDKVAFWEHFRLVGEVASALIPREWMVVPEELSSLLLKADRSSGVMEFIGLLRSKMQHVGFPCVLKLANSELGYGQSIIQVDKDVLILEALHFAIQQSNKHSINPGNKIIVEKAIPRPFFEVVQVAVRHQDPDADRKMTTTFAPPILVRHIAQDALPSYGNTELVLGPFVLDCAIQTEDHQLPLSVRSKLGRMQFLVEKMVESVGAEPGLYAVGFLVTEDSVWIADDIVVKAEDTTFVTQATQPHSASDLLTKCLAGKPILASVIHNLTFAGGVRTVLWREGTSGEFKEVVGESSAKAVRGIHQIEIYGSKSELRPLRLMGMILARLPKGASISEIENCLNEASSRLRLVQRN